jgi:hypothetical protein
VPWHGISREAGLGAATGGDAVNRYQPWPGTAEEPAGILSNLYVSNRIVNESAAKHPYLSPNRSTITSVDLIKAAA